MFSNGVGNKEPLKVAHIHFKKLDIELVSSADSKNLGRAWLSLMMDEATNKILSLHLSFSAPGKESLLLVLQEYLRRHDTFPGSVTIGDDRSYQLYTVLASLGINTIYRPTTPEIRSASEQIVHALTSKVISESLQRFPVSKNNGPRQVTLLELYKVLNQWASKDYNCVLYPHLDGQSPRKAYERINKLKEVEPFNESYKDQETLLTPQRAGHRRPQVTLSKAVGCYGFTKDTNPLPHKVDARCTSSAPLRKFASQQVGNHSPLYLTVDSTTKAGSRDINFDTGLDELIKNVVTRRFQDFNQGGLYHKLVLACREQGLAAPSYVTFIKWMRSRNINVSFVRKEIAK